jgi:hypothetical protein
MTGASLAELPMTVERMLAGGEYERVAVVLLDAFGMRFLQRHAAHPLLRRITADGEITPLRSQFPSTTTAHVTTMHTGRPVGEHGLYEWRVYEPALDRVIIPLRFCLPEDRENGTLHALGLEPEAMLPPDTLYRRLGRTGVECVALQPSTFSPSSYDRAATAGARLWPFDGIEEGARMLVEELSRPGRRYVWLYWDRIDLIGHFKGPDSPAFDHEVTRALDALDEALATPIPGAIALVTADHAQVAVSPERLDDLDVLWPELERYLTHPPAGSSRDVFLHVGRGHENHVIENLRERLADRAEVLPVDELDFGARGPRLRERLADVCVLPAPGRQAWLRSAAASERRFLGQHGGLHPDEAETWVGVLPLGYS